MYSPFCLHWVKWRIAVFRHALKSFNFHPIYFGLVSFEPQKPFVKIIILHIFPKFYWVQFELIFYETIFGQQNARKFVFKIPRILNCLFTPFLRLVVKLKKIWRIIILRRGVFCSNGTKPNFIGWKFKLFKACRNRAFLHLILCKRNREYNHFPFKLALYAFFSRE